MAGDDPKAVTPVTGGRGQRNKKQSTKSRENEMQKEEAHKQSQKRKIQRTKKKRTASNNKNNRKPAAPKRSGSSSLTSSDSEESAAPPKKRPNSVVQNNKKAKPVFTFNSEEDTDGSIDLTATPTNLTATPTNSAGPCKAKGSSDNDNVSIPYGEEDLIGKNVVLTLAHHNFNLKNPQIHTAWHSRGMMSFPTGLTIQSSLEQVEVEVNQILGFENLHLEKHKHANVMLYVRQHRQEQENPKRFATKDIQPITSTEQWKKALLEVAYIDHGDADEVSQDNSVEFANINCLRLDLLCITQKKPGPPKPKQASQTPQQATRCTKLQDHEIPFAVYLLPPSVKVICPKTGSESYKVDGDKKNMKFIRIFRPLNGDRIAWSVLHHTVMEAARGDPRYKDVVGHKSPLMIQNDFTTASVEKLESTDALYLAVRKRLKRSNDSKPVEAAYEDHSYIRVSVGKAQKDDEIYEEEEETLELPDSQDPRASPEKQQPRPNPRQVTEDANAAPAKSNVFMQKLLRTDSEFNPFYHSMTKEHFDIALRYLYSLKLGENSDMYAFDFFACKDDDASTWPTFDDILPQEVHPEYIDAEQFYDCIPQRGKYPFQGNLPKSYAQSKRKSVEEAKLAALQQFSSTLCASISHATQNKQVTSPPPPVSVTRRAMVFQRGNHSDLELVDPNSPAPMKTVMDKLKCIKPNGKPASKTFRFSKSELNAHNLSKDTLLVLSYKIGSHVFPESKLESYMISEICAWAGNDEATTPTTTIEVTIGPPSDTSDEED